MVATLNGKPRFRTLAEVSARLGGVPLDRILTHPEPGTATPDDLLNPDIVGDRAVELIDGILVEKPMGFSDDSLAFWLGVQLFNFASVENLGKFAGSQGLVLLDGGLVRAPDITFIRWDSLDDPRKLEGRLAFLEDTPDLAVEVLSPGNTPKEMAIKLGEYEAAGVALVWYVDPDAKTVTVYPKGKVRGMRVLSEGDTLDGGKVLPGFTLPVADLFASRVPPNLPKKPEKKRK